MKNELLYYTCHILKEKKVQSLDYIMLMKFGPNAVWEKIWTQKAASRNTATIKYSCVSTAPNSTCAIFFINAPGTNECVFLFSATQLIFVFLPFLSLLVASFQCSTDILTVKWLWARMRHPKQIFKSNNTHTSNMIHNI